MKSNKKIYFLLIGISTVVIFASCSVRTREHRPYHALNRNNIQPVNNALQTVAAAVTVPLPVQTTANNKNTHTVTK